MEQTTFPAFSFDSPLGESVLYKDHTGTITDQDVFAADLDGIQPRDDETEQLHFWPSNEHLNHPYISDYTSSEFSVDQDLSASRSISRRSSETSWTEEDDTGSLFFEIEQQIRAFVLSGDQGDLVIQPLTSKQRRIVHGMAHLMHLGHESVRTDGRLRRMRIFKKTDSVARTTALAKEPPTNDYFFSDITISEFPLLTTAKSLPARLEDRDSDVERFGQRQRQPKTNNGFECRFSDCSKRFDRACDRRKHEKLHQPKDSHPYQCALCLKTFMYPKDLRRHERVHKKNRQGTASRSSAEEVFDSSTEELFSGVSGSSLSEDSPMLLDSVSIDFDISYLDAGGGDILSDHDLTPMGMLPSSRDFRIGQL